MSRRKKRRQKSATAGSPAKSTATVTADVPENSGQEVPPARRSFYVAAIVFGLWVVGLVLLVVLTANPVTLNRRQLRNARIVITGEVVDLENGRVKVLETWNGAETLPEIEVEGLADKVRVAGWRSRDVQAGETYLFALSGASNRRLRVTPIQQGEDVARIYPANENTKRQLRELFPAK